MNPQSVHLDLAHKVTYEYTRGLELAGQMGGADTLPAGLEGAGGIGGLLAVRQELIDRDPDPDVPANDYLYCYDANGNVTQVLDWDAATVAGAIAAHYDYDPYGNVLNDTSSYAYAAENSIRFSTKYFDVETGLGYWGRRYYGPRLGRWLNRDPVGEDDNALLYAFVRNSPVSLADAFGLRTRKPDILKKADDCDVCGPDITDQLRSSLDRVAEYFRALPAGAQHRLCNGIVGSEFNWDFVELYNAGHPSPGRSNVFTASTPCGTGKCNETVWVGGNNGSCWHVGTVNYALWGFLNGMCDVISGKRPLNSAMDLVRDYKVYFGLRDQPEYEETMSNAELWTQWGWRYWLMGNVATIPDAEGPEIAIYRSTPHGFPTTIRTPRWRSLYGTCKMCKDASGDCVKYSGPDFTFRYIPAGPVTHVLSVGEILRQTLDGYEGPMTSTINVAP